MLTYFNCVGDLGTYLLLPCQTIPGPREEPLQVQGVTENAVHSNNVDDEVPSISRVLNYLHIVNQSFYLLPRNELQLLRSQ